MEKIINELIDLIKNSNKILVFTGAGISTPSGIPDYRGPKGIWKIREPVYFDEFLNSDKKKIEYWDYKLETHGYFKNAQPNEAHSLIKKLNEKNKLLAVITQNIDRLHHKSGVESDRIIELHGNNLESVCLKCGKVDNIDKAIEYFKINRKPPLCECGGYLKPNVVMFGEPLDNVLLSKSYKLAEECDLVIAMGSSLKVYPAANIPLIAKENGAKYVIINMGETEQDNYCDLKIDHDVAEISKYIIERL